ncbi:nitroreductase family protein [Dactylosporangium darangshiense]|uniref:Nitroreductase family protein n=1 Tax=Dactylosporangium darangshiense TaxID=579108 RepID=A0ABP8DQA3_9ACTN
MTTTQAVSGHLDDPGPGLHPILARRWSPRGFSLQHRCSDADLSNLLEAARWSPSHNNSQPWRFIVGRRGDPVFGGLLECLAKGNQRWAAAASALVCGLAVLYDDTGAEQPWARYDLGQAIAYMTVQAGADGLHSRQMAGFDAQALRCSFGVGPGYEPCIVAAFGVLGGPHEVPAAIRARDDAARERAPAEDLVYQAGGAEFAWCRPDLLRTDGSDG